MKQYLLVTALILLLALPAKAQSNQEMLQYLIIQNQQHEQQLEDQRQQNELEDAGTAYGQALELKREQEIREGLANYNNMTNEQLGDWCLAYYKRYGQWGYNTCPLKMHVDGRCWTCTSPP